MRMEFKPECFRRRRNDEQARTEIERKEIWAGRAPPLPRDCDSRARSKGLLFPGAESKCGRNGRPHLFRQRWGLGPEQRQLVLGWQRALQSGPLTGDPRTNQTDRGNNGNDQNSQQNGVFDESGTILVFAQLANKIQSFRHEETLWFLLQ